MITIQGYINTDSIAIFFDNKGIDEMIGYLNFIKKNDVSFHLTGGNELDEMPFDEKMLVIPHLKIINIDKLDNV